MVVFLVPIWCKPNPVLEEHVMKKSQRKNGQVVKLLFFMKLNSVPLLRAQSLTSIEFIIMTILSLDETFPWRNCSDKTIKVPAQCKKSLLFISHTATTFSNFYSTKMVIALVEVLNWARIVKLFSWWGDRKSIKKLFFCRRIVFYFQWIRRACHNLLCVQ